MRIQILILGFKGLNLYSTRIRAPLFYVIPLIRRIVICSVDCIFRRLNNRGQDFSIVKLNISNLHWVAIIFRKLCQIMEILKTCSFTHYLIKNLSLSQLVWCQNSLKLTCTIHPIRCTVALTCCHLKVFTRSKKENLITKHCRWQ